MTSVDTNGDDHEEDDGGDRERHERLDVEHVQLPVVEAQRADVDAESSHHNLQHTTHVVATQCARSICLMKETAAEEHRTALMLAST